MEPGLSLYELAFVAGGAERVVDTALVRMHREGRLVVDVEAAWVTVVDPRPTDDVEAALLAAVGRDLRRPVGEVRAAVRHHPSLVAVGRGPDFRRLTGRGEGIRLLAGCLTLVLLFVLFLGLLSAAIACAGVVVFSSVGEGPVLAPLVAVVVLLVLMYLLVRFATWVSDRTADRSTARLPRRARRLLAALAAGAEVPAAWRPAPEAWTPSGPTVPGSVALDGLRSSALDPRWAAAFRGWPAGEPTGRERAPGPGPAPGCEPAPAPDGAT
ncbi:TIGR04222 domain-containing membrane protein [Kitasatospora sp. NPDC002965]|uniref:TIGR04222 domain-containing membrane protein n=1 Tax=Kitasatospora sp. NPDC002965 TaxID=3154775 RepID=UPI0033A2703E